MKAVARADGGLAAVSSAAAVAAASRVIGSVAAIQGVAPSRRPYAFHWCCMLVIASEACWWVTAAHGGDACVCGKLEM